MRAHQETFILYSLEVNDCCAHFLNKDENIIKTCFMWQCLLFGRVITTLQTTETLDLNVSVLNWIVVLLSCSAELHRPKDSCLNLYSSYERDVDGPQVTLSGSSWRESNVSSQK